MAILFARSALTSVSRHGGALEDVEVARPGVTVELTRLAAYDSVCGFVLRDALPATYLHVLAFPLQVALMVDRAFPLALPGLVHVHNRIVQHRPVDSGETLDLRAMARDLRPHAKGTQVDLVGEARVGAELVWEGVSTYLARGAKAPPGQPAGHDPTAAEHDPTATGHDPTAAGQDPAVAEHVPAAPAAADLAADARALAIWQVPGDTGRRYAAVSGDVNPIHLNTLAAKAFGFPRTIVHGMWTKAHALAAIEARLPEAYAVDVAFSKPLLLPSTVRLVTASCASGWDFAVRPMRGDTDHLRGTVRSAG